MKHRFLFSKLFSRSALLLGTITSMSYPNQMLADEPTNESLSIQTTLQSIEVKGTVVDAMGEPIIGATVLEKGNPTNGTITDIDGNFVLNVSSNALLQISYVGYETQEIAATSGTILRVVLKDDSQALEEVVVVGYGIQKKVNLTGAVSAVEGEELSLRPVANATQSLQGMVPGLTVTNGSSGRPGPVPH